ncbi:4'-phosphopantetheinyl transferase superfamily protein [Ramlibacter sp. AW1]|uniref:4'-phosphopantetheinyl transferase superfamily protein n=1 Tax=Ramlibacter aurantiacus TaxID=2801330 RepID=A0A937D8N3_9BURK|nr:4'-phosphopantetheinyl transferase superfamily protein [Ramlibacter aurantiacus]MBL0423233.1 4'-phosphopantetheinyl transferase superfamily protein [Ramlibacter aurantiacus]
MLHREIGASRREDLAAHDVDLWVVPLPVPESVEQTLADTLCEAERKRAAGYAVPIGRRQFVASRGILRLLLGSYLGLAPESVKLVSLAQGKPALQDHRAMFFNISHTDGLLLVALAAGMEVGVDVERVRPIANAPVLANRFFSARERAGMEGGPDAFLRLWTCRESAVKAAGKGISAGWDAVRIVQRRRDEADAVGLGEDCHIRLLSPRPGYVAALAALTTHFHVRQTRTLSLTHHETFRDIA